VLADLPKGNIKHYSELLEEDTQAIADAFQFEQGESLEFIHKNVPRSVIGFIKNKVGKFKQLYYEKDKNYLILTNKYLHVSSGLGQDKRKVALDSITKIENLPGLTKSKKTYESLIRLSIGADLKSRTRGGSLDSNRLREPSVSRERRPSGSYEMKLMVPTRASTAIQRTFEIDVFSETATKFFVAKLTSIMEKQENVLLKYLRIDIQKRELRRKTRKPAPLRRANDLTDATLAGWLEKWGNHNAQWKKRYCVLAGEWLFYFSNELADRQAGSIDLFPPECLVAEETNGQFTITTIVPPVPGTRKLGVRRRYLLRVGDSKKMYVKRKKNGLLVSLNTKRC